MPGIEDELFVPRYNGYLCMTCNKKYLTVDLAEGKTPNFMTCMREENCGGIAVSMGYEGDIGFGVPLLFEFVKPDEQILKETTHPGLLLHFQKGGLYRRVVDTAPGWVKALA